MRNLLLASFVLLAACNPGADLPVNVTGNYHVDQAQFARMVADRLIEAGHAPESARGMLMEKLKDSRFDLCLSADGTFVAEQQVMTDSRRYKGTWTHTGSAFTLDQTHENGKPVQDRMTGTLAAGKLDLSHEGDAGSMHVVLFHAQAAAPPR